MVKFWAMEGNDGLGMAELASFLHGNAAKASFCLQDAAPSL